MTALEGMRLALVSATVGAFFLSLTFSFRAGAEPYPALMMPDFSGPGGPVEGAVGIVSPEILLLTEGGDEHRISVEDLFHPFPESAYFALTAHFRPRQAYPQNPPTGVLSHLAGWRIRQDRLQQPPYSDEITEWLRKRSAKLVPDAAVNTVRFNWYRNDYLPPAPVPESRELLGVVDVEIRSTSTREL